MSHHKHDKRQKGESQDAQRQDENRMKHPDEKMAKSADKHAHDKKHHK